jgi:hypothetical protein
MSEIGGENGGERCHWRSRKVVAEPGVVRAVRGGNDASRVRLGFRGLRDFSPPTIEEVRGWGGGGDRRWVVVRQGRHLDRRWPAGDGWG